MSGGPSDEEDSDVDDADDVDDGDVDGESGAGGSSGGVAWQQLDADAFVRAVQEEGEAMRAEEAAAAAAAAACKADVCATEAARFAPQYGWAAPGMRIIRGLQDEASIYVAQLLMARLLQAGRVLTFLAGQLAHEHTEKARVVAAELEQEWCELRHDWVALQRARAEGSSQVSWPAFERRQRHTAEVPAEPVRRTRETHHHLPPEVRAVRAHTATHVVHTACVRAPALQHAGLNTHSGGWYVHARPVRCRRPQRRSCSRCTLSGA